MVATLAPALEDSLVAVVTGTTRYFSLHTADPGATGANETTALSRQAVTGSSGWTAAGADVPSGGEEQSNVAEVNFGAASAAVTLTHIGWWDAATGGNFQGGAPLTTTIAVSLNQQVTIPPNWLTIYAVGN